MIRFLLFIFCSFFIVEYGYANEQTESKQTAREINLVKETFVNVDGAKLFCRSIGKGSPIIVIHGGPGLTQDYLLPQMYKLAEKHFVIFYDQRGCGQSTGEINSKSINMETYVKDLEAIKKAFNFDKVSVLGHSWGGFLAMEYAITYPDSINKLILANSMPASSEEYDLFIKEYMRRMAPFQEELTEIYKSQSFLEGSPEANERAFRIMFRTYCYSEEKAELLNLFMTPQASLNQLKVYNCFCESIFSKNFNLHESLKKLRMPVLVIHGDVDPIPFISADNMHTSIRNSHYVLMKNCGHFPYVEEPDLFFNHVFEFLK